MNIIELREFCLSLPCSSEDMPFDETTVCFRVANKIFAMTDTEDIPTRVNLKCEPELAIHLREIYSSIIPGYHCNKKHWNTLILDGSLSIELIKKLIQHSYTLIFKSLKVKQKNELLVEYPEIENVLVQQTVF